MFDDSVFDEFADFIVTAEYYKVDRTNPLGATKSDPVDVQIIIDEGSSTQFTGQTVDTRTNPDILIYGQLGSVLANRSCVGGFIRTTKNPDPRTFRIENWNMAGYTRDDGHIELTATEVSE